MNAEHGQWMFFGGWAIWLVSILLFVVLLYSFKYMSNYESKPEKKQMSILKELYAKGEIDDKEFEQRIKELAQQ